MKIADVLEDLRFIISKERMQEGLACGGVYFFGEVRVGFEQLDESAPVALACKLDHRLKGSLLGLDFTF